MSSAPYKPPAMGACFIRHADRPVVGLTVVGQERWRCSGHIRPERPPASRGAGLPGAHRSGCSAARQDALPAVAGGDRLTEDVEVLAGSTRSSASVVPGSRSASSCRRAWGSRRTRGCGCRFRRRRRTSRAAEVDLQQPFAPADFAQPDRSPLAVVKMCAASCTTKSAKRLGARKYVRGHVAGRLLGEANDLPRVRPEQFRIATLQVEVGQVPSRTERARRGKHRGDGVRRHKDHGAPEHVEDRLLFVPRKQPADHRRHLRAGERENVDAGEGFGHRRVPGALADRRDERLAQRGMAAFRAGQEIIPRPGAEEIVVLAVAKVAFDICSCGTSAYGGWSTAGGGEGIRRWPSLLRHR